MRVNQLIQVFEHDFLRIDGQHFTRQHWEELDRYNLRYEGKFFQLLANGVKFNQYVGVIQVGNLTIEILPKVGKTESDEIEKRKWQKVLIDMLRQCRWLKLEVTEKASLRFKPNSILEAYLEIFISECEQLVRQGLVKKYRSVHSNQPALKGKLCFKEQVLKNSVHQERFYTAHGLYDRDNVYNRILLNALKLIPNITTSSFLCDKVYSLLFSFPMLEYQSITYETFQALVFDRKTLGYKEAIQIASMILLNYRPDVVIGRNSILALLFDMNELWEEYVTIQLRKNLPGGWEIHTQNWTSFWQKENSNRYKTIRPDIVILDDKKQAFILDTKWKLPVDNIPADEDLKQMFVYNIYWEGINSVLLYPKQKYDAKIEYEGGYYEKPSIHKCGIAKVSVLDENNLVLDNQLGKRLTSFIVEKINHS